MSEPIFVEQTNFGKIEYRLLTSEKLEEAMLIQKESMRQECIALGVGLFDVPGESDQMQLVFREVVRDGCTVIAVHVDTDKVIAVSFNKLHGHPERSSGGDTFASFIEKNVKHRSCLDLINFLDDVESRVNIFEKYGVDGAMEIFYVGTQSIYQGIGVGKRIVEASVMLARKISIGLGKRTAINNDISNADVIPQIVFGVFASNYSQRIAERVGFETLCEIRYQDFEYKGKKMSERIGDVHETAKFAVIKLQ